MRTKFRIIIVNKKSFSNLLEMWTLEVTDPKFSKFFKFNEHTSQLIPLSLINSPKEIIVDVFFCTNAKNPEGPNMPLVESKYAKGPISFRILSFELNVFLMQSFRLSGISNS